jgi:hypothetical protein
MNRGSFFQENKYPRGIQDSKSTLSLAVTGLWRVLWYIGTKAPRTPRGLDFSPISIFQSINGASIALQVKCPQTVPIYTATQRSS